MSGNIEHQNGQPMYKFRNLLRSTNTHKCRLFPCIIKGWNSLPTKLLNIDDAEAFKNRYVQKFGRESLVIVGHRTCFSVKNQRNNRVYWRCTIPTCPSTVNTCEGHLVKKGLPHNHQANQSKIEVIKIMQTMKQRAKKEDTPIQSIYEEELVKLRTPEWNDNTKQIVEQLPTYYSCKTTHYHQMSLNRPVLSKITIDIDLQDE
ncbi:unnamed protein product [Mytilus coruscus]|uniref:Uncharacterized protein n=1 Tax=Mytilus coruscus TaxID=42192 RepID=A0A6J8A3J8_MYTCO|nr:unnamed protein product [Mytilus coruscus]